MNQEDLLNILWYAGISVGLYVMPSALAGIYAFYIEQDRATYYAILNDPLLRASILVYFVIMGMIGLLVLMERITNE